tara:strand:+ start:478 stop:933 length:456 start_codon:yes stop_codon:yes gene_type:complete
MSDWQTICWHQGCQNCSFDCTCPACYGQALHDATSPGYDPYDEPFSYLEGDKVAFHYCYSCIEERRVMMTEDFETPEFERAAITLQRFWRDQQYYLVDFCDPRSCDCCDSTDARMVIRRGFVGDEMYHVCFDCYDFDEPEFRGQLVFDIVK